MCSRSGDLDPSIVTFLMKHENLSSDEMDKILYSQVLITCTTINVISIISMFGVIIADKLHDRREKKKKEREERAAKDAETKAE